MPSPRKPAPFDFKDLLSIAKEELSRSISKPNILTFTPYEPGQKAVLCSQKPGRYVSGANRAGKSTIEVVDAIWNATDTHPYRKRPEHWGHGAIRIRFVVVDIVKGVEGIILPELKRWVAPSMLVEGSFEKSWDPRSLRFTFANGSTIEFLTHQMDLDKHGGVPLHIVYFDEEPPQDIFNENMMRLIDYDGWWLVAATSVNGIDWTYDYLVEPALENPDNPDIDVFNLKQSDNPYLRATEDKRNRFYIGMSHEDREIREEGKFVARSGLVFPQFGMNLDKYVLDEHMQPPRGWDWYSSVDFGFNNATAWLWHAVSPDGKLYTFAEHYQSQMTVPEHSAVVRSREAAWGKSPEVRVGDPAGRQRNGVTGTSYVTEYATHGIYINVESITNDVMVGVGKMQEYFRILDISPWGPNLPTWRVSPNCPNLIRELKKLRWAAPASQKVAYRHNAQEEIHKKDDHAADSLRYWFTLMPSLVPVREPSIPEPGSHTPISFQEMLVKLANDENAEFVYDQELTTSWETRPVSEDFWA